MMVQRAYLFGCGLGKRPRGAAAQAERRWCRIPRRGFPPLQVRGTLMQRRGTAALPLAFILLLASCSRSTPSRSTQAAEPAAFPPIDAMAVLRHTKALSSSEFEGRFPGTKGEDLTVNYIADEFKRAGLKPGNTDGTYFQQVPL